MMLLALMLSSTVAASQNIVGRVVVVPSRIVTAQIAVVCRTSAGGWDLTDWTPAGNAVARALRGRRCRVLVREVGSRIYFGSDELTWRSDSSPLRVPYVFRMARAPAREDGVRWVSASRETVAECTTAASIVDCLFVGIREAGAIVAIAQTGVSAALFPEHASVAGWKTAKFGRLVRVATPLEATVEAGVTSLRPVFDRSATLLRQRHRVAGASVDRLGTDAFWLSADTISSDDELTLSALGAGRVVRAVKSLTGDPFTPAEISLPFELTITGVVESRGVRSGGASVMLSRLLSPQRGLNTEDRPLERVAEIEADGFGQFRFEQLAEGEYEVIAVHPSKGRARKVVKAPADLRLAVASKRVRGRVTMNGSPAANVAVSVLPALDDVVAASNPMMLATDLVVTSHDGRFEIVLPSEGRALLSAVHPDSAARLDLGDVAHAPDLLDLGELRLSAPRELEVIVTLPNSCELRAAGPFGQPGLMIVPATWEAEDRWRIRIPIDGRWLMAGVCAGKELPLSPPIVEIGSRTRAIELRVHR